MATLSTSFAPIFVLMFSLNAMLATSDVVSDRNQCASQLTALATCLEYVRGIGQKPTADCCVGLKKVLDNSPKCLCLLVKDHDDPSLSIKIDPKRAMSLPSDCKASANISQCPKLLHLSPDSPDAKIFKDFRDATKTQGPANSTTGSGLESMPSGANSTSSSSTSDSGRNNYYKGGGGMGWLGMEVVGGAWLYYFASLNMMLNI